MIQYIKRKDLDVEKYDFCIENSLQSRIYAFSWYLDIVADNWDVLVLNDYEAVMPIPWKQKYFIKYVSQPLFCQQLGVFSLKDISKEIMEKFIKKIPRKFVKISLNFNSDNLLTLNSISKMNYILELKNTYDVLFKKFSKGRKHAVKVGVKANLIEKEVSILALIKMKKEFYNHGNIPDTVLEKLSNYVLNNGKGFLVGVFKDKALLGGGLFFKSKDRIIYLFSSFNTEGRKLQAASFLINNIIKKHENSNCILDFEGGELPNIGSFFKSFGSKEANYYHINYNNYLRFLKR